MTRNRSMPVFPNRGDRTLQTCTNLAFKREETQQTSNRCDRTLLAHPGERLGATQHKAGNMVSVEPLPIGFWIRKNIDKKAPCFTQVMRTRTRGTAALAFQMPVKRIQALFDIVDSGGRDVVIEVDVAGLLHAWFSLMAGMTRSQASDHYAEFLQTRFSLCKGRPRRLYTLLGIIRNSA